MPYTIQTSPDRQKWTTVATTKTLGSARVKMEDARADESSPVFVRCVILNPYFPERIEQLCAMFHPNGEFIPAPKAEPRQQPIVFELFETSF